MAVQPWYKYTDPYTWDFGQYNDPDGNFLKPDANFGVPDGVPITALLPGTVSGINTPGNPQASPSWGQVVTVKLDQPWNSAAQYAAYLHLGSVSVVEGQHVNAGDTVGVAGADSMGEHYRVGFALQSGPYYGFGSGFSNPGDPSLSPNSLIQQAISGKITVPGASGTQPAPKGSVATVSSNPLQAMSDFFGQLGALADWLGHPIRIVKMATGVMLIGIALFLLVTSNETARNITQKAGEIALLA